MNVCYPNLKPESVVVSVVPTDYPVTLEEAKLAARISFSSSKEDSFILRMIKAATEYCQNYQWSQLMTATHVMRLDRFPGRIELWPNPVQSISSVQYVDTSGTTQTLTVTTDYVTDIYSKPARVVPAYSTWWPATRGFVNDVTVTYVTGYASADSVPDTTKQAILLLVSHWYRFRETVLVGSISKDIEFSTNCLLDLNSYRTFY